MSHVARLDSRHLPRIRIINAEDEWGDVQYFFVRCTEAQFNSLQDAVAMAKEYDNVGERGVTVTSLSEYGEILYQGEGTTPSQEAWEYMKKFHVQPKDFDMPPPSGPPTGFSL